MPCSPRRGWRRGNSDFGPSRFDDLTLALHTGLPRISGIIIELFTILLGRWLPSRFGHRNGNLSGRWVSRMKRDAINHQAGICILAVMMALAAIPPLPSAAAATDNACLAAIPAAEARYDIPQGLLQAIGEIESNLRPLALNIAGHPHSPETYQQAIPLLYRNGEPRNDLNIGCMQIHSAWHLDAVDGQPERFLDPVVNVDYAAQLLRRLYDITESWSLAVGRYHTGPDSPRFQRYICAVDQRLRNNDAATSLECP